MSSTILFRPAGREDLERLLAIQRQAFGRVSCDLDIDPSDLPPLNETLQELQRLFDSGTIFMTAEHEGELVGAVRCTVDGARAHVGRLVVATGHLRTGVGLGLMKALEAAVPGVRRFELFTGAGAVPALNLYARLEYVPFRREHTPAGELVWLCKDV